MAERQLQQLLAGCFEHFAQRTLARLDELTDDEYLWEPVAGCWTVRRVDGRMVADWMVPAPDPAPVTTIAWRLHHIRSFLAAHGLRAVAFERGDAAWDLPKPVAETAAAAVAAVGDAIAAWRGDLARIDDVRLWEPLGPAAGPFAEGSVASFVEHIHDEFVHHAAEVALLRDLYRAGSMRSPA